MPTDVKVPSKREAVAQIMNHLRRIFKSIQEYSRQVLERYGVTGPQLWTLRTLHEEGPLTLRGLSDRMFLDPSTAHGVVDRLEARGLLTRRRSEEDQRTVRIALTSKGRELVRRAPLPAQGRLLHALLSRPKDEVIRLHAALTRLVEFMEVGDLKATFFFSDE